MLTTVITMYHNLYHYLLHNKNAYWFESFHHGTWKFFCLHYFWFSYKRCFMTSFCKSCPLHNDRTPTSPHDCGDIEKLDSTAFLGNYKTGINAYAIFNQFKYCTFSPNVLSFLVKVKIIFDYCIRFLKIDIFMWLLTGSIP